MKNPQRQKAYSYVRFSTTDQKKGDSLDRQMEKTLKYIKEHDLENPFDEVEEDNEF